MSRTLRLLIILTLVAGTRRVTAEPTPGKETKTRAALYQRQVRAELQGAHWRITTDSAGRIVATHLAGVNQPGYDPLGYFCLVVSFRPKSTTDTECSISEFFYPYAYKSGAAVSKSVLDPMPITNPMQLKDIDALLAKARKRLWAEHPEYAPPASH